MNNTLPFVGPVYDRYFPVVKVCNTFSNANVVFVTYVLAWAKKKSRQNVSLFAAGSWDALGSFHNFINVVLINYVSLWIIMCLYLAIETLFMYFVYMPQILIFKFVRWSHDIWIMRDPAPKYFILLITACKIIASCLENGIKVSGILKNLDFRQ